MAKINRSNLTYVKLPDELATTAIPEAKCQVSVNVTLPKKLEKYGPKILDNIHDEIAKMFKKESKKRIDKVLEDE